MKHRVQMKPRMARRNAIERARRRADDPGRTKESLEQRIRALEEEVAALAQRVPLDD